MGSFPYYVKTTVTGVSHPLNTAGGFNSLI